MNKDSDDFKKKFDEIINSEDLKKISDEFETEITLGTKELLLLQQALSETISHVSEILLERNRGSYSVVFQGDSVYHSLLSSMYKICEDFNEVMLEYYSDLISDGLDDDDDEDENDDGNDDSTEGPF